MGEKHNAHDAKAHISQAVREAIADVLGTRSGYLDPSNGAAYMGISVRTFESGPAREIPCHRLTPNGKRLYKREDLDEFMRRHRQVPAADKHLDSPVDDVLKQVRR